MQGTIQVLCFTFTFTYACQTTVVVEYSKMWHSHFTGTVLDIITQGTHSSETLEFKDFQVNFYDNYTHSGRHSSTLLVKPTRNHSLEDIPVHC